MPTLPNANGLARSLNKMSSNKVGVLMTTASVVLFALGLLSYFSNWPRIWDIALWDESLYMGSGIYTWDDSFKHYEWSPLYSWIYHVAHGWIESPTTLFYTVGLAGVVSALAGVYFAAWRISRSIFFATLVACVLVLSNFLMIHPRAIYPTIAILSLGAAIAFSMRTFAARCAVLALATFLVTFMRPEFALSFYLFGLCACGATIWALVNPVRRTLLIRENKLELSLAIASLAAIAILSYIWMFPVIQGGERALAAFAQHYAAYWAQVNHGDTFVWFDFQPVFDRDFPGAHSEFDAVRQQPLKMLGYFLYNVASLLQMGKQAALLFVSEHAAFAAILGVAVAGAAFQAFKTFRALPGKALKTSNTALWMQDALLWIILACPTMISIVLIFAEGHYAILLTAMLTFGAAIIARHCRIEARPLYAVLVSGAFVLLARPAPEVPRPTFDIVQALQKQGYMGRMLDNDGGWCLYVPNKCVARFGTFNVPDGKDFLAYMHDENIDTVAVSDWSMHIAKLRKQQAFLDFVANPEQAGWHKIQLTPDEYLLKRNADERKYLGSTIVTSLISLTDNIKPGDQFGVVKDRGNMALFIHPGASTPTTLDLKLGQLARTTSCRQVQLVGYMDPNIPADTAGAGGAQVGMTVMSGNSTLFSQTVSTSDGAKFTITPSDNEVISLKIDNHGNANRDWFNLYLNLSGC